MMTIEENVSVGEVRSFWEEHPLFAYESQEDEGSTGFFDEHSKVRFEDVDRYAMHLYEFDQHRGKKVLDIGCGIGWLCENFARGGAEVTGVDLTNRGAWMTRRRCSLRGYEVPTFQAHAAQLPFDSDSMDFVTCAGVLHHTPDFREAVSEIHRVLRPGARGMISLYYTNWLMRDRMWPVTRLFVRSLFGSLPGRHSLRNVDEVDDFVRIYDGDENPLGKSFNRAEARELLQGFAILNEEIHYFPRRFLPFAKFAPGWLHRLLDRWAGTMIYLTIQKQ